MPDNLYRRGKTWWARVQVDGKDHRRSLRTASLAEARQRLKIELEKAGHFRFHGESRHTWKEAAIEWSKDPGVKPRVVTRYLSSIAQLRTILDPLYVDEINRGVMSKIARRSGVTNATRRRDLTAVSAVLRWCVGHEWAEENHARTWDRSIIRERRDPIVLPSDGDIAAVIAACPGHFADLVQFAQFTGMREEECAGLEWYEVSEKRAVATLTKTKTSRPRAVPLDDRALKCLPGTAPGTAEGGVIPLHRRWVFWHGGADRYENVASKFAAITARLARGMAAKKRPFRRFRFHDLRHWYAVDYLKRGGSIYMLQKILGHASIRTTEGYLSYLAPDEQVGTKDGTAATVRGASDAS